MLTTGRDSKEREREKNSYIHRFRAEINNGIDVKEESNNK